MEKGRLAEDWLGTKRSASVREKLMSKVNLYCGRVPGMDYGVSKRGVMSDLAPLVVVGLIRKSV